MKKNFTINLTIPILILGFLILTGTIDHKWALVFIPLVIIPFGLVFISALFLWLFFYLLKKGKVKFIMKEPDEGN